MKETILESLHKNIGKKKERMDNTRNDREDVREKKMEK